LNLILIFFLVVVVSIFLIVVFVWCASKWPEQLEKVSDFIWGVLQIVIKSQLLGLVVGALLTYWVNEQITDLQHRPAFVSESLAFVVEFTAFYDQQSRYFRDVADLHAFFDISLPQQKAFIEETLTKLSNTEKQTDLLEFKATRFFHGTGWLEKFEEIHGIWNSGAATTRDWARKASNGSISSETTYPLSTTSDQLSQKTAELLKRFVSLLKNLPPESSVFQQVPTPTPAPTSNPNSVE